MTRVLNLFCQLLIGVLLMAVVVLGVSFEAVSKLLAEYLRTLAGSLGSPSRTAIEMSAWAGILIGALWAFEVALQFALRAIRSAAAMPSGGQLIEFVAGGGLVSVGVAVLVAMHG